MTRSKYLDMSPEQLEARINRIMELAKVMVADAPWLPDGSKIWQWTDKNGKARCTITTAKWDAEMYGVGMYSVAMADYDERMNSWGSTSGQAPTIVEAIAKWIEQSGWYSDVA